MLVQWVLVVETLLKKIVDRISEELEKGQRTSALVSGSWPYSEDFKALARTVSHLTSEETYFTTHSNRPEDRHREWVKKESKRGKKHLSSFPALQRHLHWCTAISLSASPKPYHHQQQHITAIFHPHSKINWAWTLFGKRFHYVNLSPTLYLAVTRT